MAIGKIHPYSIYLNHELATEEGLFEGLFGINNIRHELNMQHEHSREYSFDSACIVLAKHRSLAIVTSHKNKVHPIKLIPFVSELVQVVRVECFLVWYRLQDRK